MNFEMSVETWNAIGDALCIITFAAFTFFVVAGGNFRGLRRIKGKFHDGPLN